MAASHRSRLRRDPFLIETPLAPVGVGVSASIKHLTGAGPSGVQWMPAIGPNHAEYEYGYHYLNYGNDYVNFTLFDEAAWWLRQEGKMHNFAKVEVLLRPSELLCLSELVGHNDPAILSHTGTRMYHFDAMVGGHLTQFGFLPFVASLSLPPGTMVIHNTDAMDRRIAFTPQLVVLPQKKRFSYLRSPFGMPEYGDYQGRTLIVTNIRSLTV